MNYNETVEYLYNQLPVYQNVGGTAYKEGLDNSLALDSILGHPHRKYKTIHVAGTNGKGSTSHLLAAILQQSGYKTGLYTSPHLVDFRERIRIDGQKISEQYVIDFVSKYKDQFEPIHPSFFELTMMMAFRYFADQQIDIAIVEVGLGGRLDSTNIITPDLSVITNISFDHVQFLGNTLEKIAGEKAGIIKPHIPVVIGEAQDEVRKVFEKKASEVDAPIIFAEDEHLILSQEREGNTWIFDTKLYPHITCELGGFAQAKNTATVLTSVEVLKKAGYNIADKAIYGGFKHVSSLTGLMGRWQVVKDHPKVVLDTGHNVGGITYIAEQFKHEQYNKLHIVLGMVNDKDISKVLALLPQNAVYYFTRASIARALDSAELQIQADKFGLKGNSFPTVIEAVDEVLSQAKNDDMIFIGGSNFVVGEALSIFV